MKKKGRLFIGEGAMRVYRDEPMMIGERRLADLLLNQLGYKWEGQKSIGIGKVRVYVERVD